MEAPWGGEWKDNEDSGRDRNEQAQPDRGRGIPSSQLEESGTGREKDQEWKAMENQPGEASDEANKATAKIRLKVTKELREQQDRLTGATAALIVAIWEAGSGAMEETLLEWLEEQGDRMETMKESLDQKRRELTRRGSGGQGRAQRRDSILRREMSRGGSKGRPSSKAPSAKGPKDTSSRTQRVGICL